MAPGMRSRVKALAPLPENLFFEPLEYLSADAFRSECMSAVLDALSTEVNGGCQPTADVLETLKGYLERDLPLHRADKESDLFPRLQSIDVPNMPVSQILALVLDANKRAEKYRAQIVEDLQLTLENGTLPDSRRFWQRLGNFCELTRWIVETENRVVLPLARANLGKLDLSAMAQTMAKRREANDLFETP